MAKMIFRHFQDISRFALGLAIQTGYITNAIGTNTNVSKPDYQLAVDSFAAFLASNVAWQADIEAQKTAMTQIPHVSYAAALVYALNYCLSMTSNSWPTGQTVANYVYWSFQVVDFSLPAVPVDPAPGGGSSGSVDVETLAEAIADALGEVLQPIVLRINNYDLED